MALPTIAHDFHVSAAQSVWVVNGPQLATTSSLLLFSAIGDARGSKRVYLTGLCAFTLATLGCMLAPSFGVLVVMRVLQGLGSAAVVVMTNAQTRALFPAEHLGRSVAMNAMFVAVGTAAGPTLGGLILAVAPWPFIFAVIVPLCLTSLALGVRSLPALPGTGAAIDYRSGLLAAAGFGSLIFALDGVARRMPWVEAAAIAVVGVAAMTVFLRRQLRMPHPMLAVELFRVPIFSVAVVASVATYAAQSMAYVALPFFLQSVLGHSPLVAGLLLSAWPAAALVVSMRMGHFSDRYPASLLCTIGVLVMGTGLGLYALLPAAPATLTIVACAAIAGAGFAIFQTPNTRAIIATVPPEDTGRAAAVVAISRLSGQTSGAALVALVFELAGAAGGPHAAPSRGVIEAALLVACGFMFAAAVLSAIRWNAGRSKVAPAT